MTVSGHNPDRLTVGITSNVLGQGGVMNVAMPLDRKTREGQNDEI